MEQVYNSNRTYNIVIHVDILTYADPNFYDKLVNALNQHVQDTQHMDHNVNARVHIGNTDQYFNQHVRPLRGGVPMQKVPDVSPKKKGRVSTNTSNRKDKLRTSASNKKREILIIFIICLHKL